MPGQKCGHNAFRHEICNRARNGQDGLVVDANRWVGILTRRETLPLAGNLPYCFVVLVSEVTKIVKVSCATDKER